MVDLITDYNQIFEELYNENYSDIPLPIYKIIFGLSYEYGHSYGKEEIDIYLSDLKELALEIMDYMKPEKERP